MDKTVEENAAVIAKAVMELEGTTEAAEAAEESRPVALRRFKRKAPGCPDCGGPCDRPCSRGARGTAGSCTYDGRKKRRVVEPLPLNFGQVPEWLSRNAAIGGTQLHESHVPHLAHYRGLTWCWRCGYFAILVPNKLTGTCKKPTVSGHRQLTRLKIGQTPRNEIEWPNPV